MSSFLQKSKKWTWLLLTVALVLTIAPQSQAAFLSGTVPVMPGTATPFTAAGLVPPGTPAGTQLASLSEPYSFNTTAGTTSGTLNTAVYRNPSGTLDFYYQVANSGSSTTSIARESNTNFTLAAGNTALGYRVDAATLGAPFADGTVAPTQGDVSTSGPANTVGFQFGPPDNAKIAPGKSSTVFVVSTNATAYTTGNAELLDGGSQTVTAFQPANVPEPGTMVMLGAGLLALAGFRKFRR